LDLQRHAAPAFVLNAAVAADDHRSGKHVPGIAITTNPSLSRFPSSFAFGMLDHGIFEDFNANLGICLHIKDFKTSLLYFV
jgi:hypothetical protein